MQKNDLLLDGMPGLGLLQQGEGLFLEWGTVISLSLAVNGGKQRVIFFVTSPFMVKPFPNELNGAHFVHLINIPGIAVVVFLVEPSCLEGFQKDFTCFSDTIDVGLHNPYQPFVFEFNEFSLIDGFT